MSIFDFWLERRKWDAEVDAVAVKLLRRGVPPYDAMREAVEIVSQRRERAATLSPLPAAPGRPPGDAT